MRYTIEGAPLPVVVCQLSQGETMITERGGMSWMSPNMRMETNMEGGLGRAFGRVFSGESMFMNRYTCFSGDGMIAFASSLPGQILAFDITPDRPMIAQKSAFLAAQDSVELSVFFNRKVGAGLFGGEGFIMQKLSGRGLAFVEIDGHCAEYTLTTGQSIVVSTGHLAAMEATVSLDIQTVSGLKNKVFGGEGFFCTVLTGPGKVWLQSMPVSGLAASLIPFLPTSSK